MALLRRATRKRFAREGWVQMGLLKAPFCREIRDRFLHEVKPYDGPLLRQLNSQSEPHRLSDDGWMTNPIVHPHLLPVFPGFSTIERDVMRAAPLVEAVEGLMGAPVAMLQSAYYESSLGTKTHLDFNPLERTRPMVGVWIALEDIGPDAGRFFLYPNSHLLPDSDEHARFAELAWASYRQAFVDLERATAEAEAQALLGPLLEGSGLEQRTPALGAGDVLFWTNRVLHGSHAPKPGGGTRHSLLLHFVERDLAAAHGLLATQV